MAAYVGRRQDSGLRIQHTVKSRTAEEVEEAGQAAVRMSIKI